MSQANTYAEIAADFRLWQEFMDPDATMSEAEFIALSVDQKIKLQTDAFGPESREAA